MSNTALKSAAEATNQSCDAFFGETVAGFQAARANCPDPQSRTLTIAGHKIRLEFANSCLVADTMASLSHLQTESMSLTEPDFTIHLWDSESTDIPAPDFPWLKAQATPASGFCEETYKMWTYADDRFRLVVQPGMRLGDLSLSVLDTENNQAVFWVPSRSAIPYYDVGSPLRALFHWWFGSRGMQMVHAAAVGNDKGGVLIVGKSHSGKSTTALACLEQGLKYVGDDYALIGLGETPRVYSLYNAAKLNPDNLFRFPNLAKLISNQARLSEEKALLFLHPSHSQFLATDFPIRAVLTPSISGINTSSLEPISPAASLAALAPSTMFQLNGASHQALQLMAKLVRSVPNYTLHAGTDLAGVKNVISELLN